MTPTPKTKRCIGELPPFWDRSAIFFSNIHSIFYDNHEEAKHLLKGISGATGYGGRVLCVLNLLYRQQPNLILLEAKPDEGLTRYLSKDLGLSLPDYAILDHPGYRKLASSEEVSKRKKPHAILKKLMEHPAHWIDGFVTDSRLAKIASVLGKQTISTLQGSKNGNNKYLLYQYLVEQKLPVGCLIDINLGKVVKAVSSPFVDGAARRAAGIDDVAVGREGLTGQRLGAQFQSAHRTTFPKTRKRLTPPSGCIFNRTWLTAPSAAMASPSNR